MASAERRAPRWRSLVATLVVLDLAPLASGGRSDACRPTWYTSQLHDLATGNRTADIRCPYGVRLPGDITWPTRVRHTVLENAICVFYGYIPVVVIVIAVVEFLVVRGTRELFFVLYVAVTTALNEVVLKGIVTQPRPAESCCTSCGMPSSHSTFALGFYTLMFLDAASRVNPMAVGTEETIIQWEIALLRGPLSNPRTLSNCAFISVCLQWGLLLLPVPLSRIYLRDHSVMQVLAGSAAGLIYAFVFFYGVYEPLAIRMRRNENWRWPRKKAGQQYWLKNTIKLPWWRQEVTLETMAIADCEPGGSLVHDTVLVPVYVKLQRVEEEDGTTYGVMHGFKLQVHGGKWAGVAWPLGSDKEPLTLQQRGTSDFSSMQLPAVPGDDESANVDSSDDSAEEYGPCVRC